MTLKNKLKIKIIALITFCAVVLIFIINIYFRSNKIEFVFNRINNDNFFILYDENIMKYEDEIKKEISNSNSNFTKSKGYLDLGYIQLIEGNYELAEKNFNKSKEISSTYSIKKDILINNGLSIVSFMDNDINLSQKYYEEAIELAKKNKLDKYLGLLYSYRAKTIVYSSNLDDVIDLMNKSLKYDKENTNIIYNKMFLSQLYSRNGSPELARESILDAADLSYSLNKDELVDKSLISLANVYFYHEIYNEANSIYSYLYYDEKFSDLYDQIFILEKIIGCNVKFGNYDKADYMKNILINKVEELRKKEKDNLNEFKLNYILNNVYLYSAEYEVERGNIEIAKDYLSQSVSIMEQNNSIYYKFRMPYLKKIQIDINRVEGNYDFNSIINEYESILSEIGNNNIDMFLKSDIINTIIYYSLNNYRYDIFNKYTGIKEVISMNNYKSADDYLTNMMNLFEMKDYINNKEIKDKKRNYYVGIITLLLLILCFFYMKNRRIKQINNELHELNMKDVLTDVYNKRVLHTELEKLLKMKAKVTFIMIDIDYFKLYNDNYGHIEGDKIIILVSDLIKKVFNNDIVARYGGEEFTVISTLDVDQVVDKIKKLQVYLKISNLQHKYSKVSDRVTLSIGIDNRELITNEDVEKLIEGGDRKLYISKRNGRNTFTI